MAIPVAPVVVWVSVGKTVSIHNGVVTPGVTVLLGITIIIPVALNMPQPPVNGIL